MISIVVIVYVAITILTIRWAMDVDMRAFGDEEFDTGFDIITGIMWPIGVPTLYFRVRREFPDNYKYVLFGRRD